MAVRAQQIQKLQEVELKKGIFDELASFHGDFKDCPWIKVNNLHYDLTEGDIITVFEQYGTINKFELIRDKKTGDSRGTAIMSYEDWRSTVLAVDNLNGITLLGRIISVDHCRYTENEKSQMIDPRKLTPARLATQNRQPPQFDEGSASSTETDEEY